MVGDRRAARRGGYVLRVRTGATEVVFGPAGEKQIHVTLCVHDAKAALEKGRPGRRDLQHYEVHHSGAGAGVPEREILTGCHRDVIRCTCQCNHTQHVNVRELSL